MGKITVPLSRSMLQAIVTQGSTVPAYTVIQGVPPKVDLVDVSMDEYGVVRLRFDDPDAEEDGEIQVLWKFNEGAAIQNFLFGLKAMRIAEITHWSNSSRLRFVGVEGSSLEVKFDIPVAGLEISIPHEGPFFITVGKDNTEPGGKK